MTSYEEIVRNRAAMLPPELARLMNANDEVFRAATICAQLAADADPSALPVADDYIDALDQLDTALAGRVVPDVRKAAHRYHDTFDLTRTPADTGENERQLLDAVAILGRALAEVEEARPQVLPIIERGNRP
ncbi:hypothetical protein ABZ470_39965 [Streptosporangium sp. NPDC020072]|uniref:hypothetical protein n=1 Tax=Streptosporangium sp. NPDC020072 TaxID=3154788 RepID=UPI00342D2CE3